MLYHPVTDKIPTFSTSLEEGVNLAHKGGGIYCVLTDNRTVNTKHVRAMENQLLGIASKGADHRTKMAGIETDLSDEDYLEVGLDKYTETYSRDGSAGTDSSA